jgi:PAS domain S-box-containing protein
LIATDQSAWSPVSTALKEPTLAVQDLTEARERFLAGDPVEAVRPVVLESWKRCVEYGVNPDVLPQQVRDDRVLRTARERGRRLLDCAEAPLRHMHRTLGDDPHLIALADEEGRIIRLLHSEQGLPGDLDAANLFEGASWHEREIGCNGVGTCLAAGEPVVLIGPEHYQQAYLEWTCIGVPIRATSGRIIGALDLSVPTPGTHPHTWGWTLAVAESIQDSFERWGPLSGAEAELSIPAATSPLQTVRGVMRFLATRLHLAPSHARYLEEAQQQVEAAEEELQSALQRVVHNEQQVRKELTEIEALYATAPVGLCVLDHTLRFVRINQRLAEINGLEAADHIGRTVAEVLPDLAPTAEPVLRRVLESGEPLMDIELSGMTPAQPGVLRHWLEHFIPLRDSVGNVFGISIVAEEVTEQKQAAKRAEQLHAATKRALAQRDEVLAIVSHDLRNPLSTIGMASQLLVEPGLPDERREVQAEVIRRCVHGMSRLIQDLLDVARIEGGGLGILREPLGAAPILSEAADTHGALVEAKGVQFEARSTATRQVSADRERILQVFANLITNALEHTPAGGSIRIGAQDCDGGVCFAVSDTGAGILPEHMPRVFDRFWQASKQRRAGAGLGLAIARGIVEAHGGSMEVESAGEGRGTTFRFMIPSADR